MTSQTFAKPAKLPIQIIGPTPIARARAEYRATWKRDWPHSNSYLAELIIEAKESLGIMPRSKERPAEVRDLTLTAMRLDHHF